MNEPSAETPTSKTIKTGEVSQIIEDENGKQIIESKYDLKEQSGQNDYDTEIMKYPDMLNTVEEMEDKLLNELNEALELIGKQRNLSF